MTPKIILVLGTTYTGKSWVTSDFVAHLRRPFIIIVHTHPDESYLHQLSSQTRFVAVSSVSYRVTSRFLEETRRRYRCLWLSVYDLDLMETREFLSSLAQAIKIVGNLGLVIDEAHLFCSRFQVPRDVIGFIRGARFYGVDVVFVTHRLKDLDIGIRCVLTHLVLFRTVEQADLDVLAGELDMRRAAEQLRLLPNKKHLFVNRHTGYISLPTQT